MDQFFDAVRVFFEELADVKWSALGIAVACHLARLTMRVRAWRAILQAAYPDVRVPRRSVFGAYVAGVGVNSVAPARGGDLVKLYLAKNRIEGSTYSTLGSTLIVETLFDFVIASLLLLWALQQGVLPSLDVIPNLPTIDWSIPARHPLAAGIVAGAVAIALAIAAFWIAGHVAAFQRRVSLGFTILRTPRTYFTQVVPWQAASWVLRLTAIYWFLKAFSIPATVENAFLVQVVQSLSTALPFTPGGAGTEQGLIVYIFRGEVPYTDLLSFSVGMTITLAVVNAALGFGAILLMLRTLRWRRVVVPKEEPAR